MIAGTYSFVYCGANDVGMGQFIIGQDGGFAGADLGGLIYTGIARENDVGWITLEIQLTIPAGTAARTAAATTCGGRAGSMTATTPITMSTGSPPSCSGHLSQRGRPSRSR